MGLSHRRAGLRLFNGGFVGSFLCLLHCGLFFPFSLLGIWQHTCWLCIWQLWQGIGEGRGSATSSMGMSTVIFGTMVGHFIYIKLLLLGPGLVPHPAPGSCGRFWGSSELQQVNVHLGAEFSSSSGKFMEFPLEAVLRSPCLRRHSQKLPLP